MDKLGAKLKLEHFINDFYSEDEQHGSIVLHPWEELLLALTRAKVAYPAHQALIEHYIQRYQDMGDRSLDELIADGYDMDGLIFDLERLKREISRGENQ